jgi:hypothetical protein
MSDSMSKVASIFDKQIYINVMTKMRIECKCFAKVKTTHADVFKLFEASNKWITARMLEPLGKCFWGFKNLPESHCEDALNS